LITHEGLHIPADQLVKKGDILIVLQNDELDGQIDEAKASIQKQINMLSSKKEEISNAALQERKEEGEQRGNAASTVKRLEVEKQRIMGDQAIAERQLTQLLKRKEEKLIIRAQADGRIPDFQLRQLLEDRPVRVGDHLFDIMNEDGGWHMELLVEEKRMGHLLRAQRDLNSEGKSMDLAGEFKLASQPEKEFTCHLRKVATRSTTDTELGTVFELTAEADPDQDLPPQRIGVEVTVHLYCGKTSLAYWCFGDVVEFVQKYIWL